MGKTGEHPKPRTPIAVLPPEIAERIAAGEVVERPASVVRELLDNAVDAGARAIGVELRGGGIELIRVSDDGAGIPPDEVELAFQHHATSKLRSLDDLLTIRTLGFRGEALPSIAAVSDVELLTRDEHEPGTVIAVRAGAVLYRRPAARQRGTTVSVRNLFANVPARRKFLSAGRPESLLVGQLVRRYAMANPAVSFSLFLDGRLSFRSDGSGQLSSALEAIYGATVAATLVPLPAKDNAFVTLRGFLSDRAVTRPSRDHLTLIVNGRWVACRGLSTAIEAAYRPLLPRGRHPIAALVVEVPPSELDPNVHPTKAEVRLIREAEIIAVLADVVRETLGRAPVEPAPAEAFLLGPEQPRLPFGARRGIRESRSGWGGNPADGGSAAPSLGELVVLGQVHESLILAEGKAGLYLIDQHRAHERIIFEQLRKRHSDNPLDAQILLEPLVLELKSPQVRLFEPRLAELADLGFSCQHLGGRDFLVRGVPAVSGAESFLAELPIILEAASADDEDWQDRLLTSLACRGAIRRNRSLTLSDMTALVQELATTTAPAVCPHGSPLIMHLSHGFLERQFNW
ncbi:MAG TPA: DNA mismatch repair endonuclease MutL [Chloroflexota bacterium]|nr:DNA mismatch repair endonuclease MutL [Chloroflexota bacterium]